MEIKFTKADIWRHVGGWSIFFINPIFQFTINSSHWKAVLAYYSIEFICYLIPYYFSFLVLFPRFYQKNLAKLVFSIIVLSISIFAIDCFANHYVAPRLGWNKYLSKDSYHLLIKHSLAITLCSGFLGAMAYLNRKKVFEFKKRQVEEQQYLQKELQLLKGKYNSLFVTNFLSASRLRIRPSSMEIAKGIETFSNMLQYSNRVKTDQLVPLKQEINYIDDFILLQRSLNENLSVVFEREEFNPDIKIFPRILISLVENAFKHGDVMNPMRPIKISIKIAEGRIVCSVENRKVKVNYIESTGIGNLHLKKILDFFYRDQHLFKIIENDEYFKSELVLNF